MLPAAAAAMIALAACGTGTRPPPPPPASGGANDPTGLQAAARCMREHGHPDFPDPVEHDGRWSFPLSQPDLPTPPAPCTALFDATKQGGERHTEVTAEDMLKLRQWADCIRKHGVPDWPDPDSAGTFQLPQRLTPPDNDPAYRPAYRSCEPSMPPHGVDIGNVVKPHPS
jgi:hypothetical protein